MIIQTLADPGVLDDHIGQVMYFTDYQVLLHPGLPDISKTRKQTRARSGDPGVQPSPAHRAQYPGKHRVVPAHDGFQIVAAKKAAVS